MTLQSGNDTSMLDEESRCVRVESGSRLCSAVGLRPTNPVACRMDPPGLEPVRPLTSLGRRDFDIALSTFEVHRREDLGVSVA